MGARGDGDGDKGAEDDGDGWRGRALARALSRNIKHTKSERASSKWATVASPTRKRD